ncbi:peptidoglycan bridge formation glycyltransferase FemA/FemB family protein [Candidatus Saccharibacteria bacterium]|nr:peptidoglycan bridge formation glycyltransferase FemA/FemB family protein [Candidatus Saccharibacteria bacterium]
MEFTILTPEEFTKFESKHPLGNFYQSAARAKLREKMGWHTYLLGIKDKKTIKAAALLIEKNQEALIQMGPILDYSKEPDIFPGSPAKPSKHSYQERILVFFLENLKIFAKNHNFIQLEIFPPLLLSLREIDGSKVKEWNREKIFQIFKKQGFKHEGFTTKIENKSNRWMFSKDLSGLKTFRDIELSLNSSTRKKLHKTSRELDIKVLTKKSELKEWLTALEESDKRNGVHTRSVEYFEDLWDAFGENAIFVEARRKDNGELVSSEVDILHPNEMVAFVAGTIEKNKHYNGSVAIKGFNLEKCLELGQTRLNLYGMEGDFSPENPLLHFKSGLKGISEEYIGGFRLVLKPARLFLRRAKRRL